MITLEENQNMDSIEMQQQQQDSTTLRRTLTLKNNAARQIAVNFMPSRQPYSTLRHRRCSSDHNALLEEVAAAPDAGSPERQADFIVREMEQHRRLMDDDPQAEELRREALRDLPQGLTMKRHVRAKLSASVSLRSKRRPISLWKRTKYRISFAFKRGKDRFRDVVFSMELWYEAIRRIEGQFGSAVGSYFRLLRWLFLADLALAVATMAFIVVPQALHDRTYNDGHGEEERQWGIGDFLRGTGSYADSVLFYGHYHSDAVSTRGPAYSMPFAYFFTMGCLYLAVFAVLCYRTSYSYRRTFIERARGLQPRFAGRLFSGWDFGVASASAARLASAAIYNEFKELLNEQHLNRWSKSAWRRWLQYGANTAVTLAALSTVAALLYGVWQLVALQSLPLVRAWALTAVLALCPLVFGAVVRLEFYSVRAALYVTLSRSWLLHTSALSLLLYYWASSGEACWETRVGQEGYRLLLLDCLVSLFILPIFEFVRGTLYKRMNIGSPPEFNLAYNFLTLLYNQALLWFGLVFSPPLAFMVTVKMILLFYVKRQSALNACQPPAKIWRASQTQTVLYMLVTLSLFITMFLHGSLFLRSSSHECGPLVGYEYVYSVFTEGVLHLSSRPLLSAMLHFLVRPGVLAFVALFLGVGVYYTWRVAVAQRSMAALLRGMLVLQAKDKEFLLAAIDKVANGEWLYSRKSEGEEGDSHTWRYLQEVRKPSNAGFHFDASRISHGFIDGRPRSLAKEVGAPPPAEFRGEDGDTDSSFSWQGSARCLHTNEEFCHKLTMSLRSTLQ